MEMKLPELGEGIYEAEFIEWLVQPGDKIVVGQPLAEVMTDKATVEIPSPFAGTIQQLRANADDVVEVGGVLLEFEPSENTIQSTVTVQKKSAPISGDKPNHVRAGLVTARTSASPHVRRKARELGIDISQIQGSGPGGRVLDGDLDSHSPKAANTADSQSHDITQASMVQPGSRIRLAGLKRISAKHMVHSKQEIPHYSYIDECDVTDLVRMRTSLVPEFKKNNIKLTYLAFIVKGVARALSEVPLVNSKLDTESNEIIVHDRINIGIAVATAQGLIVPVIKNADQRSLGETASEIARLSGEAHSGSLRRDDLSDGTFTVSSVGGIGGLISTPIINHPECGILAVGKIVRRPVYDDLGQLRPADLMYFSFSFDHRVLDGAVGAVFSNAVIEGLQNPARLLV